MLKLRERPLIFLDTETTGLNPEKHEIIELAMIRVEPSGERYTYHWYIKPEHIETADEIALRVNKYHERIELWEKEGVTFASIAPILQDVVRDGVFAGHNVGFDLDFLSATFKKNNINAKLPYHKVDTVTLAYAHLAPLGLEKLSLDTIRDFFGWSREGNHTAMQDVRDTMKLYNTLTKGRIWCYWAWFKRLWR